MEKLYNNILLSNKFEVTDFNNVPYLKNPPEVTNISVGRQLFVDDFLIKTTSYSMARINEHKILTSKEIKDFVQNNFLLTNYRGL